MSSESGTNLDCSQPPYFSVGFSRPVGFDGTAAIFVYISERDLGRVSKAGVGVSIVGERKRKNRGTVTGICKTRTGWLRMADADGGWRMGKCRWKNADDKIK